MKQFFSLGTVLISRMGLSPWRVPSPLPTRRLITLAHQLSRPFSCWDRTTRHAALTACCRFPHRRPRLASRLV